MAKSLWRRMLGWLKGSPAQSRRFGEYHIVRILYEGEKTIVHQARSPKDDALYAIKVYKPAYNRTASRICKRYHLRTEGEVGLLLNPPAQMTAADYPLVRTISYGWEFNDASGCYYLVQEFLDALNMKRLIGGDHPPPLGKRLRTAMTIARALSIIHERGLVHRDVCTDNILVGKSDGRAKLVDFGFVVPTGLSFMEKSGTPSYMSPEHFLIKPLMPTSDIYSFGVVLFELLTKQLPFESTFPAGKPELLMRRSSELMAKHVKEAPPRPSELCENVPDGADAIVLKCLEKAPEKRYQKMNRLMADLSGLCDRQASDDAAR